MKPAFPFVRVKTPLLFLAALAVATLAVFALSLLGQTTYSPDVWTRFPSADRPLAELDAAAKIFWGERLPKTVLAALAGAALALAGLTMQTLFRNDLATPY
ncbi:MAG: iron chelate uptake ABC transporter family permease subunit, partial [Thermoguttaceae bacterium]|nr:iron chelate uptake ABC transporter family permease subunit [Thermoguttaceae bacterium]